MEKTNKVIQVFFREHQNRFSSETERSYRITLEQFFLFCQKEFEGVTSLDIRAWLSSLEEEGKKPFTVRTKLAGLKSFYHFCLEEGLVGKNPTKTVPTPKKDDREPSYLNKRQLAQLKELTRKHPRDRAIIEALYATGLRISELLSIKLVDLSKDPRQIYVVGKGNKSRFVMYTYECLERLETYLNHRSDESEYLFSNGRGKSLRPITVQRKFQEYSDKLGFKATPHTLRHTFAAHLAEKNMDESYIQDLLGHDNISSTQIYTDLMEHARKKEYDRYQV